MFKPFKKNKSLVDVLVLVIGHQYPDFLADTAESFEYYNRDSLISYRLAFAVDHNRDCADALSQQYGDEVVYCSASQNGWGRGIIRTMAFALDHFHRNGLMWEHLITVDSDALIVGGPLLEQYVSLIEPGVCFVGQKWGGDPPYSSSNPGPTEIGSRLIKYLAKLELFHENWQLLNYHGAGPFLLWTRQTLDFMKKIELLPGSVLDGIYQYVLFPHDLLTTFILGVEGHEFRDVGVISMLYCGDVGGNQEWHEGMPSVMIHPYGEIPVFPKGTGVIHPIRSKKFSEGDVRLFFRKLRIATRKES